MCTYHIDEVANALGRIASAAQSHQRRHAVVQPCTSLQLAPTRRLPLAHDGVGEIEAIEFVLVWAVVVGAKELTRVIVEGRCTSNSLRYRGSGSRPQVVALPVSKSYIRYTFHCVLSGGAGAR